jgi:DNA-binding response OmpR family regulator
LLNVLNNNLLKEGYGVLVAQDGQEALQVARCYKPDLTLLDLIVTGSRESMTASKY